MIDSLRLLRLIEDEKLSVLNLPAPFWHAWVRELATTGRSVPPCLRLLVVGSERFHSKLSTHGGDSRPKPD